jgi:hypothetical protein
MLCNVHVHITPKPWRPGQSYSSTPRFSRAVLAASIPVQSSTASKRSAARKHMVLIETYPHGQTRDSQSIQDTLITLAANAYRSAASSICHASTATSNKAIQVKKKGLVRAQGQQGRETEHTIFWVERPQPWPLLRSIRPTMGFVCGLPSAPGRRTCCSVCTIGGMESWRVRRGRSSLNAEANQFDRTRTYSEELERVRWHHAVVVVRRQQHRRRVLPAAAGLVVVVALLPRPPHVVERRVPAPSIGRSVSTQQ